MRTATLSVLFLLPSLAHATGPGEGTTSQRNVRICSCTASTVTVKYQLDSLMGEPTVKGSYKWEGPECTLPSSTVVWLEVSNSAGLKGYVRMSPATPKAGGGYGYDTTGSPNWDKALCGYSGTRTSTCLSPDKAKELLKTGSVKGFHISW